MKLTIITVSFNRADVISRAIESVYRQLYKDLEYIVIDGGSSDNTVEILEHWSKRFKGRLHYVSEPDNGVYDAINKGIRMSEGDVIGILHSDDFFTQNNILSEVVKAFEDPETDMVYGDVHFISKRDIYKPVRYYSAENFTRRRLRYGFAPPHPSMYCRRSVFDKYGLYNDSYSIAGDFEFFVRVLWNEKTKAQYIPIDMVAMRRGGLSTSLWNVLFTNTFEKLRALRDNKIGSNYFLMLFRYMISMKHYFKKPKQF